MTNKIKILAAFGGIVWLLSGAARAQTEMKITPSEFTAENLQIKREFSLKSKTENEIPKAKEFNLTKKIIAVADETENNSVIGAPRQQPYVRPSREARFKRYASDAFGVPALIGATFGATFSQIGNDPPEWEKNAKGFGKRFASSYATNAIRNSISYGLSETFQLDNRFEKRGSGSFGKRLKHVFLGSYTTRTKNGKRIPDFPYVTGTYAASVIANEAWFPDRFSYKDGLRDGTISLGIRFGVNLLREFVFPD